MTPDRRTVLSGLLVALALGAILRGLWLTSDPPTVRRGRHRVARRGRLGPQRQKSGAVGRLADRRLEPGLHRASIHGGRIRRVSSVRGWHVAGACGAARVGTLRRRCPRDWSGRGGRVPCRRRWRRPAVDELHLCDVEPGRPHGIDDDRVHRGGVGLLRGCGVTPTVGIRGRCHGHDGMVLEGCCGIFRRGHCAGCTGNTRRRAKHAGPMGSTPPGGFCDGSEWSTGDSVGPGRQRPRHRGAVRRPALGGLSLLQLADVGDEEAVLHPQRNRRPCVVASVCPGIPDTDVVGGRRGGARHGRCCRSLAERVATRAAARPLVAGRIPASSWHTTPATSGVTSCSSRRS